MLETNNALLAGGSILNAIHNFPHKSLVDLDIYVNFENFLNVVKKLKDIGYIISYNISLAPAYDQSFFRKNNILFRLRLHSSNYSDSNETRESPIDIMVLPNNINPKQVVTNFDLTFCEIWYDGKTIDATDLNGVLRKKGQLREEYTESYIKYNNKFIGTRMKKYTKRGFIININTKLNNESCFNSQFTISDKKVFSEEEWVTKLLYKIILDTRIFYYKIRLYSKCKWINKYPLNNKDGKTQFNTLKQIAEKMMEKDGYTNLNKYLVALYLVYNELYNSYILSLRRSRYSNMRELGNNRQLDFMLKSKYLKYFTNITGISENDVKNGDKTFYEKYIDKLILFRNRGIRSSRRRIEEYIESNSEEFIQETLTVEQQMINEAKYNKLRNKFIKNIKDINLEKLEVNIDENIFINDGKNNTCIDLFNLEDDVNILEHFNEDIKDNFLLVKVFKSGDLIEFTPLCFDINSFEIIFNDLKDSWFYECFGTLNNVRDITNVRYGNEAYIKILAGKNTNESIFIPATQIKKLIKDFKSGKEQLFYAVPRMDKGEDNHIEHKQIRNTATWKNRIGFDANHVGANHCQAGSSIFIYDIKLCSGKCVVSNIKYNENMYQKILDISYN